MTPKHSNQNLLIYGLVLTSGIPTAIYLLVWQRVLFTLFGIGNQSVYAGIAMGFIGLGIGNFIGGLLSRADSQKLMRCYGWVQACIALYGFTSLTLFRLISNLTVFETNTQATYTMAVLLMVSAIFLGAALPIVITLINRVRKSVYESVSILYFSYCAGVSLGFLLCGLIAFRLLGLYDNLLLAALMNAAIALIIFAIAHKPLHSKTAQTENIALKDACIPLWIGAVLAIIISAIALGYKILWVRAFFLMSGSHSLGYVLVLAVFLAGTAIGALFSQCFPRRVGFRRFPLAMPILMFIATIVCYLLLPFVANFSGKLPYYYNLSYIVLAGSFLGAMFPMVCGLSIHSADNHVGGKVALLYIAVIFGAISGIIITSEYLLENFSLAQIALLLAAASCLLTLLLFSYADCSRQAKLSWIMCALVALNGLFGSNMRIYDNIWSKLLYGRYYEGQKPRYLIENKQSILYVSMINRIFDNGALVDRFNLDPQADTNDLLGGITIGNFLPHPSRVLLLGVKSGSWAQVLAQNPEIKKLYIIEPNKGYLDLIANYPDHMSLLSNPKVTFIAEHSRHWLRRHQTQKFDLIIMTRPFYSTAFSSLILSQRFFELVKLHLTAKGIYYFNAVGEPRAISTALSVFSYAYHFNGFILASDHQIDFDDARLQQQLYRMQLNGNPLFPDTDTREKTIQALLDRVRQNRAQIEAPPGNIITDDNMGEEWHLSSHPPYA